jgi:hypothetical protein
LPHGGVFEEGDVTPEQRSLIERTLRFVGLGSLLCIGALVLFGAYQMVSQERSFGWFVEGLLDPDDGGAVLYPLIGIAAVALWIRSFMRKARSE